MGQQTENPGQRRSKYGLVVLETEFPKADVTKVLAPYSERMKTLLKNPSAFYTPKERPSGHDIAEAFGKDNGGAIPSNLLQIPNTESNSHYSATARCSTARAIRHDFRLICLSSSSNSSPIPEMSC